MQDYKSLKIWQYSHVFTIEIYKLTVGFPKEEVFGLTSQLRRATTSIELNIAEGCGRDTNNELKRFLYIAMGSAFEVECNLLIVRDLNYISNEKWGELQTKIEEIKRMMTAFIKKLG